jgi:nucleotide-binding universal stress UspA family protein
MKLLMPVDGSDCSNRAVGHLIKQLKWYKGTVQVHLLNVQPPVAGTVSAFVGRGALDKYRQEEGMKGLKGPMRRLDAAKINYQVHIGVGDPAKVIAGYAREKGVDQILMGTRGLGSVSNFVLGSVAMKVIHLSPVPVVLVK